MKMGPVGADGGKMRSLVVPSRFRPRLCDLRGRGLPVGVVLVARLERSLVEHSLLSFLFPLVGRNVFGPAVIEWKRYLVEHSFVSLVGDWQMEIVVIERTGVLSGILSLSLFLSFFPFPGGRLMGPFFQQKSLLSTLAAIHH